jgi:hypothetical protein
VPAWLALIPTVGFFALDRRYDLEHARLQLSTRAVSFYERAIARIDGRWIGMGNNTPSFADPTSLYANDLDIFGTGSLFELLCAARTRCGQQTLASWLCNPASRPEILRRHAAVEELRNDIDLREELALFGPDRPAIDFDILVEWAERPSAFPPAVRFIAPLLVAWTLSALAFFYWFHGGITVLTCAVIAQIGFAVLYRERVHEVTAAVHEPAAELDILRVSLTRLEREQFSSSRLQELKAGVTTGGKLASQQIASLVGLVALLDYRRNPTSGPFLPLIMWSTQLSFAIENWRRRHAQALSQWITIAGEFEALSSLAGYAFEHPTDPFPEILDDGPRFEARDLRHPLMPRSTCVPNSICLDRNLQLLVVSGSNMSGKSTLLRTVGINLVLAQAGAPVCATQLKCSLTAIGSTVRVQDSLQGGVSRFYAEIRRLKEIMNIAEQGMPVLFLLDEILHGTNSHDRRIGAEAIVREFVKYGAMGLLTTHDLSLATVADGLAPRAANVHFRDRVALGQMVFDYVLHPGVVQASNALELMRSIGLRV